MTQMIISPDQGLILPGWTNATRPAAPTNGQSGFNSQLGYWEQYLDGYWIPQVAYNPADNPVINGAMEIDQVNAGAAVTVNTSNTPAIDMMYGYATSGGVFSLQRMSDTPPPGFRNYLRAKVTTANSSPASSAVYMVYTKIEGINFARFAFGTAGAKTITLPFMVRSSIAGTFGGALVNGGNARSYPFTYTISAGQVGAWIPLSITLAGDTSGTWATDNTTGCFVEFDLGCGSSFQSTPNSWQAGNYVTATGATQLIKTLNATLDITGLDLVAGATGRPYPHRTDELQRCERYRRKVTLTVRGYASNAGAIQASPIYLNPPMRTIPAAYTIPTAPTTSNCGTPGLLFSSEYGGRYEITAQATGEAYAIAGIYLLNTSL